MRQYSNNGDKRGHGKNHDHKDQPHTGGIIHGLHDFLIDAGVSAERSGELPLALGLYEEAVRSKPDSALAWYNYGDVLLSLKRTEEAVSALCKAVELSPTTHLFRYDLGLALFELGRHTEASKEFAPIVACDPHLKRASSDLLLSSMTNLALCQNELGHADKGVKVLSPARQKAVDILYNLAMLNYRANRLGAALPLARAAALLTPKSEDIVHLVGCVLMEMKREREAMVVLHQATRLNPRCAGAWADLGLTLTSLKQRKKARACFQKALRLVPGLHGAYYGLACLDSVEENPDAAFNHLDQAVHCGFRDLAELPRDIHLSPLRRDIRWNALVDKLRKIATKQ